MDVRLSKIEDNKELTHEERIAAAEDCVMDRFFGSEEFSLNDFSKERYALNCGYKRRS